VNINNSHNVICSLILKDGIGCELVLFQMMLFTVIAEMPTIPLLPFGTVLPRFSPYSAFTGVIGEILHF
jgi:hypothetical protein